MVICKLGQDMKEAGGASHHVLKTQEVPVMNWMLVSAGGQVREAAGEN